MNTMIKLCMVVFLVSCCWLKTSSSMKIGAISYWDSTSDYQRLPSSGIALINPNNGMLKASRADVSKYGQIVKSIKTRTPSVSVLGYVPTGYGDRNKRSYKTIEADIKAYFGNYSQLNGIFFDEIGPNCATGKTTMSQIRPMVSKYKSGAKIVWNPGNVGENSCYITDANRGEIVMDFESSYNTFKSTATQNQLTQAKTKAKERGVLTWHAIHTVPSSTDMKSVVDKSKAYGADYVYVTNLGMPNPYNRPPTYWQEEMSYVK